MSKAKGRATSKKATAKPPAAPRPSAHVTCVLGENSPVGGLVVGNARVERSRPGVIPRAEFDRLQAEYDLQEVKEE